METLLGNNEKMPRPSELITREITLGESAPRKTEKKEDDNVFMFEPVKEYKYYYTTKLDVYVTNNTQNHPRTGNQILSKRYINTFSFFSKKKIRLTHRKAGKMKQWKNAYKIHIKQR